MVNDQLRNFEKSRKNSRSGVPVTEDTNTTIKSESAAPNDATTVQTILAFLKKNNLTGRRWSLNHFQFYYQLKFEATSQKR